MSVPTCQRCKAPAVYAIVGDFLRLAVGWRCETHKETHEPQREAIPLAQYEQEKELYVIEHGLRRLGAR